MNERSTLLGPALGHLEPSSVKIWIHRQPEDSGSEITVFCGIFNSIEPNRLPVAKKPLALDKITLWCGLAEFDCLTPGKRYYYGFFLDPNLQHPLDLKGLELKDLFFDTPSKLGTQARLGFVLVSCHNPDSITEDGFNGFGMWNVVPQILRENPDVQFFMHGGDQVYCDDIEKEMLNTQDDAIRNFLPIEMYQRHWRDLTYRRVLASKPSYMVWDDHDITDGWGSREDSFGENQQPTKEWTSLFQSAKNAFWNFQASKNPQALLKGPEGPFDDCFLKGDAAFVMLDLRTNRNAKEKKIWDPSQLGRIQDWIHKNRKDINYLFVVSPVVFTHGDPKSEEFIGGKWINVLKFVDYLRQYKWLKAALNWFDSGIGDLRDDLNDSWGSAVNVESAEVVLDYLFDLQNPADGSNPIIPIILSGDIHASGYSMIYSQQARHASGPSLHHIVSSPVSYKPFPWLGEAYFRSKTKTTDLSLSGKFKSQISHHFTQRAVTVISLRKTDSGANLKVKFYLEGFEEPQLLVFDLERISHRENINWTKTGMAPTA